MSSLEERARAAVRATAAEIGPDDVPPPRSLGADGYGARGEGLAGRWPARHQGGRRSAAWSWGVPLAAAAAVVAVVAAAGLLSGVVPSRSHAPRPAANPAKPTPRKDVPPGYPPNLVAGLTGLYVPASGPQYSAGALFMGEMRALENKIAARCMAGRGYRYPANATPAELARGDWDLTQFPDLGAIARAGGLPSNTLPNAPAPSQAYRDALDQCMKTASAVFRPLESAARPLMGLWITVFERIQASAPVTATMPGLRACAARYGWPSEPYGSPNSTISSLTDFVDWIASYIDGAGSRGASDAQLRALNRHWGAVFVRCARPTVAVMERLQLAAQQVFLSQHQQRFAAAVTTARAVFAAAERLTR
jgi:hypothetical protein